VDESRAERTTLHGPFGNGGHGSAYVIERSGGQHVQYLAIVLEGLAAPPKEHTELLDAAAKLTLQKSPYIKSAIVHVCRLSPDPGNGVRAQFHQYWTPVPVDVRRLAEDALQSLSAGIDYFGPFCFQAIGGPVEVFALDGYFAGNRIRLYGLWRPPEESGARPGIDNLFYMVMAETASAFRSWPQVAAWLFIDRGEAGAAPLLEVRALSVSADLSPESVAEAIVSREVITESHDGVTYVHGGDSSSFAAAHLPGAQGPPLMVNSPSAGKGDTAALAQLSEWHARDYLPTAELLVSQGKLIVAYAFYLNHLRLTKFESRPSGTSSPVDYFLPNDPRRAVEFGIRFSWQLMMNGFPDYAEGVASAAARLASDWGLLHEAIELRINAATSATTLGRGSEALAHYDVALELERGSAPSDSNTSARLYWNFAKSSIWFFAHSEVENVEVGSRGIVSTQQLSRASEALDRAALAYRHAEESGTPAVVIEIYRQRIVDLTGEHERALSALRALQANSLVRENFQLLWAARLYELLALHKLAGVSPTWQADYEGCLERFIDLNSWPNDSVEPPWLVVGSVLAGETMSKHGRYGEALALFERAYALQQAIAAALVRPPEPHDPLVGWLAIDILDFMQHASHLLAGTSSGADSSRTHLVSAFVLREAQKSHWFQRDFGRRLDRPSHLDSTLLDYMDSENRRMLLSGITDQRDLEASIAHLAYQAGVNLDERGPRQISFTDLLGLESLPDETAFVSLYAGRQGTYVTVIRGRRSPQIFYSWIEIPRIRLRRLVASMQAYYSGAGLYAPIDPMDPWCRHAQFLAGLDEVAQMLKPLAEILEGAPLIVISPHSYWHNIPIHGLLLPHLQHGGNLPGITHVPSLHLLPFLHRRYTGPDSGIENASLITAPGEGDDEAVFRSAHDSLARSLTAAGIPVQPRFRGRRDSPALHTATPNVTAASRASTRAIPRRSKCHAIKHCAFVANS
jgi:tetratricopeptide (TPR) repeat protein